MAELKFAPPRVRVSAKLDLERAVHAALTAAVEEHNRQYPEAGMKIDDAISDLVNRAVNRPSRSTRKRSESAP